VKRSRTVQSSFDASDHVGWLTPLAETFCKLTTTWDGTDVMKISLRELTYDKASSVVASQSYNLRETFISDRFRLPGLPG
jgi:hypothetical protein